MLIMLVSPTFARKLLTTSSNLSCPTSMQSVWRMVLVRIFLSDSFAATSSGALGFSIRLSDGLAWTGTLRCISIFAAADDAMGLTGCPASCGMVTELGGRAEAAGMTIFSPQEGQLISEPAPVLSTASSWLHLGQSKMMSIVLNSVGFDDARRLSPARRARRGKSFLALDPDCP